MQKLGQLEGVEVQELQESSLPGFLKSKTGL